MYLREFTYRSGCKFFQKSWICNKTLTIKIYPHFETEYGPATSAYSVFSKVTVVKRLPKIYNSTL